jgi:hypothetical protein
MEGRDRAYDDENGFFSSRLSLLAARPAWRVACALAGLVAWSSVASARTRPLFEPTDLEMEDAGISEVDLQIGAVRGQGPWRAVLPDFEIDVGLLPNLELDLDGAYAIEGPARGPFSFDHAAPDSLFPSLKIGLIDDAAAARPGIAVAAGIQLGPKLPVAAQSHGVGFEGLALVGFAWRGLHTAVNLGGFVDPATDASSPRPKGLELGLDLDLKLDARRRFSLTGEVSAVRFISPDPPQLLATGGVTWSASESLDLSLVALAGFLSGSDRYGLLLGVSPKFRLFHSSPAT